MEGQRGLELWQLLYENELRRGNREASEANIRAQCGTAMVWTMVDSRKTADRAGFCGEGNHAPPDPRVCLWICGRLMCCHGEGRVRLRWGSESMLSMPGRWDHV